MKKIYFLPLFFVLCNHTFCQTPNFSPFAYGVSFGSNINMGKPKNIAATEFEKKNSVGYHLGALVSFRKPKYFLETGIEFLSEGYSYKQMNKEATKPTIDFYLVENKFYGIAVPLKFSKPFADRYVTHVIGFSLLPKIMLRQTVFKQVQYKNGTQEKEVLNQKSQYAAFYPSVNLSYGVEIPVNYNEEAIRIEPYAQFSFIRAKTEALSNTLTGFGLRVTFLWMQ